MNKDPHQADIWLADLSPAVGHEQGGLRPVLILSVDRFNVSRTNLCIVVPLTSAVKGLPIQVPLIPPEGGIVRPSVIKSECLRSISHKRLIKKLGTVSEITMGQVADMVKVLLGF